MTTITSKRRMTIREEGDGLNLAPTDGYSDVDGTVDIRVWVRCT